MLIVFYILFFISIIVLLGVKVSNPIRSTVRNTKKASQNLLEYNKKSIRNNFKIKKINTKFRNNIKKNINVHLDSYFNKDEIDYFKKYKKFSKTLNYNYGQITICPSKYIEDLPQLSWHGYFINNLMVYPVHRNKGYGKELIRNAIKYVKKKDGLYLISQVKANNEAAVSVHINTGFEVYSSGYTDSGDDVNIYILYL